MAGCAGHPAGIGVPFGADAVVLSITAVTPPSSGHFTAYPSGTSRPNASTLNYTAGRTVANLVIAKLSADGHISIYNSGDSTHAVVDVLGWYWKTNEPRAMEHTAWAWGQGLHGQLGNAVTPADSSIPVRVTLPGEVTAIAGGSTTGYAVTADGTAWSWGNGDYGALGDGTTLRHTCTPMPVSRLSDVVGIAAGSDTGYALKSDGTVWSWGDGIHGQLGNGLTNTLEPMPVTALTAVTAITGAYSNAYALKSDGTVWSWGHGPRGALGNGSTTNSPLPVQVTGLSNVIAITAGFATAYALKSDGTVWAWGYGLNGALGDGKSTTSTTPVQVNNLTDITAIAATADAGFATRRDGTLWVWGEGTYGELGNGTTGRAPTPIHIAQLTDVTAVGTSDYAVVATTSNGTTWAWGQGQSGELGNGTTPDITTPHTSHQTERNQGHHRRRTHPLRQPVLRFRGTLTRR